MKMVRKFKRTHNTYCWNYYGWKHIPCIQYAFIHSGTQNHRWHRDMSLKKKMNCCNRYFFAI